MINFILIGICISAGYLLKRLKVVPEGAHKGINVWIIFIAVPSLSLKYIPTIQWHLDLLLPILMPMIVWSGAWLTMKGYSMIWPMDGATRTALTLTAGLCNTSFIGFPLIVGFYGDHALPIAVVCDQISFVIMSTLGAIMALSTSPALSIENQLKVEKTNKVALPRLPRILLKIIGFPPFIGFCAALILPQFVDLSPVAPLFDKLAATLVPLALFSVGMQLSLKGWQEEMPYLLTGLSYKLVIAPCLILILICIFNLHGLIPKTSLLEAAMPPMITAGVIATEYDLNPKVANLMVGIGILISFISTSTWWWLLNCILLDT